MLNANPYQTTSVDIAGPGTLEIDLGDDYSVSDGIVNYLLQENDSISAAFDLTQVSTLSLDLLSEFGGASGSAELLDSGGNVIATLPSDGSSASLDLLEPGEYTLDFSMSGGAEGSYPQPGYDYGDFQSSLIVTTTPIRPDNIKSRGRMRTVKRSLLLIAWIGSMLTATAATPDLAQLQKMIARFQPTPMQVDVSKLSPGDRQALGKLIEAARVLNDVFLTQMWSGNQALYAKLRKDNTPLGKARLDYFWLNKSPWSEIDDHDAFLPDVPPKKLPGANFYPEDMTRAEFEAWAKTLSKPEREQAEGFFTVIHRDANRKLYALPYSQEYRADLEKSAKLLEEAAGLTGNATLKKFLTERAAAFRSNNYYDSDIAWMDLDAPIDVTIGPYETYNDDIFGYKAAFEAYINVRDEAETAKLRFFADHLQEVENNLPIDPKYRNPKLGASSPIRVVNEIFDAGDAAHGVQTAAYNLPNDERVVTLKGSKRVMLKNVQEAKFHSTLEPIAKRVLSPSSQKDLNFDSFFTHILAHELSHGIGPHQITVAGRATSPRQELKELYSAIEEAKADVTGLFMLQHLYDKKLIAGGPDKERQLYTTFLASTFRTLRFGLNDAHGKGMAMQVNYITDKGGFIAHPDGTFEVDFAKIRGAVRDLDHDLLTIEATGDYAGGKQMLDQLGVIRPNMQKALQGLQNIPVDIRPEFVTANQLAPGR